MVKSLHHGFTNDVTLMLFILHLRQFHVGTTGVYYMYK